MKVYSIHYCGSGTIRSLLHILSCEACLPSKLCPWPHHKSTTSECHLSVPSTEVVISQRHDCIVATAHLGLERAHMEAHSSSRESERVTPSCAGKEMTSFLVYSHV